MTFHAPSYRAGYDGGQHDLLTLLACDGCDDAEHVNLSIADQAARDRYRLWCLAHNLVVGAALCLAFYQGELAYNWMLFDQDAWQPGCGRSAP